MSKRTSVNSLHVPQDSSLHFWGQALPHLPTVTTSDLDLTSPLLWLISLLKAVTSPRETSDPSRINQILIGDAEQNASFSWLGRKEGAILVASYNFQ